MNNSNKIVQGIGIPYSALLTIIFGMMLISFPIGAYVVFNSQIGGDITFEFPISGIGVFLGGIGFEIPISFDLGDAFIVLWSIYLVLFSISLFGPKLNFLKTLALTLTQGKYLHDSNYMVSLIHWFTILILVSAIINFVQFEVGIITEPPDTQNDLIQFFDVTKAPIIEEVGFRVMLIGLPLFAIYSFRTSFKNFIKVLWKPYDNLHAEKNQKAIVLIVIVAIFFGISHLISGESWSSGKFAQATASGIIIGWVYFRYGFVPAILIHWATNYFIFSYAYFISEIGEMQVYRAFDHSLLLTLETMLIICGIISIAVMIINFKNQKKDEQYDILEFDKNDIQSGIEESLSHEKDTILDENPEPKSFSNENNSEPR